MRYFLETIQFESKKSELWKNSIIKLIIPEFDENKDMVFFFLDKGDDAFFTKLLPVQTSEVRLKGKSEKPTLLKKSGSKIHSDDFVKHLQKAQEKNFKIYFIQKYDSQTDNQFVIPFRVSKLFDPKKGWIENSINQNSLDLQGWSWSKPKKS